MQSFAEKCIELQNCTSRLVDDFTNDTSSTTAAIKQAPSSNHANCQLHSTTHNSTKTPLATNTINRTRASHTFQLTIHGLWSQRMDGAWPSECTGGIFNNEEDFDTHHNNEPTEEGGLDVTGDQINEDAKQVLIWSLSTPTGLEHITGLVKRISTWYLTKYKMARVLGRRAL